MKRSLFIPLAAVVVTAGLLVPSHEVGANVVPSTEKPRISAARCAVAKGRITNITDTMKNVSERRVTTYTDIRERTVARMTVLKQKEYDTSKLQADLGTINTQIGDYHTKAEGLYSALNDAQNVACDDDDGAFKTALGDARAQLKTVREASQAIHQTFRTSVIPDIKAAATWLKDN